ncbi:MAG: hypothetical protein Q9195_009004 [Heterodermia aff. obscurata]
MSVFKYRPLGTSTTIRLVRFPRRATNHADAKLHLTLYEEELAKASKSYYALSYVWGNTDRTHKIIVNGQEFYVTSSLMFFLTRTREAAVFWIDAICINQDDLDEKSQQIPRMKEIYQNARMVVAELGSASFSEEVVFDKMPELSLTMLDWVEEAAKTRDNNLENAKLPFELIDEYDDAFWRGLSKIFDHPWWERVWVLQEATAGRQDRTLIQYGSKAISLNEAISNGVAVDIYNAKQIQEGSHRSQIPLQNIQKMAMIYKWRQDGTTIPLLGVLEVMSGLQATDTRDLVFAALNIASDIGISEIQPTYKMSVAEVFRNVAVHHLLHTADPLRVLSHCGNTLEPLNSGSEWPSWVPPWQHEFVTRILPRVVTKDGIKCPSYNPFGLTEHLAGKDCIEVEGDSLKLHGICIDSLHSVSNIIVEKASTHYDQTISNWLPEDPDNFYFTGETKHQAVRRTVVADLSYSPDREEELRGNISSTLPVTVIDSLQFAKYTQMRRLAYTKNGYMALVSHHAREGDFVYALYGGHVLYVLRPKDDNFVLVGECYVHGLMDGEILQMDQFGLDKVRKICIV